MKMTLKYFVVLVLVGLCLVFIKGMASILQNNVRLDKLTERMKIVEAVFTADFELISSDRKILANTGSGIYCVFELENTYIYPSKDGNDVVRKMNQTQLPDIDVRSDRALLKISARQTNKEVKIFLESGPWDGHFDPRCYN